MKIYIVVCVGYGKNTFNGKPVAATFGAYRTQAEARAEIERLKASGPCHFALDEEWFISQDSVYDASE